MNSCCGNEPKRLENIAVDPVCGMRVDTEKSLSLESDGRVYHFCGEQCRSAFTQGKSKPSGAPRRGGCCCG